MLDDLVKLLMISPEAAMGGIPRLPPATEVPRHCLEEPTVLFMFCSPTEDQDTNPNPG